MDIQVKTSSGWTAPSLPFAVLSAPTITPVAPTTGAFAQGVQIGDAQTAGLQAGAEKLADALNPVSQKERALKSAQIDEEASMLSRRQKIRASADAQTGAFNAAATPPPASGAAFSAPKANAASAAADVAAPLPEADPGAPPALLDPASKGKATGALAPVGTQPTGAGTAAPAPAQTDSGALAAPQAATPAKPTPYKDGSVFYSDQNGMSHIDITSGSIVRDKLTHQRLNDGSGGQYVQFFNELGNPVTPPGAAGGSGSGGKNSAGNALDKAAAEALGKEAPDKIEASREVERLATLFKQKLADGYKTGVFKNPYSAETQELKSIATSMMLAQGRLLPGGLSDSDRKAIEGANPNDTTQQAANIAIANRLIQKSQDYRTRMYDQMDAIRSGKSFVDASRSADKASPAGPAQPVAVNSQADYDKLPSGSKYVDSTGQVATKR